MLVTIQSGTILSRKRAHGRVTILDISSKGLGGCDFHAAICRTCSVSWRVSLASETST